MSDELPDLHPAACRAARALAGWGVRDLATKAGVSVDTISQFENGRPMRESNRRRIVELFAEAGVDVLNGEAPGARMRPAQARESPCSPYRPHEGS